MWRRTRVRERSSEAGFTLVESMMAMVVFMLGSLALAALLAVTTTMQMTARSNTIATRAAQDKLDELMKLDLAADPAVQITPQGTDSLNDNVANYFDTNPQANLTRRWRVDPGPTAGTRTVTVRVISRAGSTSARTVDVASILRAW